jgi:Cytochrome c
VIFEGPWGVVLTANITSDKEHGIGNWTDQQIIRAITQGVSANGRELAPPMRAQAPTLSQLTQQDLQDLIAYMRSLPPQKP